MPFEVWIVICFIYITIFCISLQLEYDILQYIVIERLAQGGRAKLKDDGLNLSDWLQCLASFWAHLYVLLTSKLLLHSGILHVYALSHLITLF